jgi:uncharacterized protein
MLIDIHTHFSRRRVNFIRKYDTRLPCAADMLRVMNKEGIDKAVILPCVSPECQEAFTPVEDALACCQAYPDRFVPFCNLDGRMVANSSEADFRPLLAYYKKLGCRGVGEYVTNLPFDHPLNMNVFRQVEEMRLPLTFHIAPAVGGCYGCYDEVGLPRLERVLKAFPKLTLLGHSQPFWAEISAGVTRKSRNGYPRGKVKPGRVVQLMRKYENLQGDLSAGSGHNAITRDPEFGYRFLEEFQDRLYFGTDICDVPQENPIIPFFRRLQEERLISRGAYEKIAWKNAAKLLA